MDEHSFADGSRVMLDADEPTQPGSVMVWVFGRPAQVFEGGKAADGASLMLTSDEARALADALRQAADEAS